MTRPLANLSFAVDRAIWGSHAWGFRLTNVLLHALNVVLVYAIASAVSSPRTSGRMSATKRWSVSPPVVAFAASVLLAVHPLMSETVGYVSARSEVLCATFMLTAILTGDRWLRLRHARWAFATLAAWIAATSTKEVGAMFPLIFA